MPTTTREYVVINTHRGLYRYTRLPFGIASAPAVFQCVMDQILQGLEQVTCYLQNLSEVLRRLGKHGVRLKQDKCHFMQECVEYLGHRKGLHTTDNKLKAIAEASEPENVQELRAFLTTMAGSSLIGPL